MNVQECKLCRVASHGWDEVGPLPKQILDNGMEGVKIVMELETPLNGTPDEWSTTKCSPGSADGTTVNENTEF